MTKIFVRFLELARTIQKRPLKHTEPNFSGVIKSADIIHKIVSKNVDQHELDKISAGQMNQIGIYKNVVSFPMSDSASGYSYYGGLMNPDRFELLQAAILMRNGKPCQKLPIGKDSSSILAPLPEADGLFLFAGILFNNFGHFLVESLGRLWAYNSYKMYDPYIVFYSSWGMPEYWKKGNYMNDVFEGLGIPVDRIVFFSDPVRLKCVLVPEQKYGFGLFTKRDPSFLHFVSAFKSKGYLPERADKHHHVYVSRSGLPIESGRPIGEAVFEEYLKRQGYFIFYPERHTIYEQLRVYKEAKRIIFCDGSSIHSCILLPDVEAEVAIIARRRDPRWTYEEITAQFMGFNKHVIWIDEVIGQYQFGLESWDAVGELDWKQISRHLKDKGYVNEIFAGLSDDEYKDLKKMELLQYIQRITSKPQFLHYLLQRQEQFPQLPLGYGGLPPGGNMFNTLIDEE
ncbi:MAG: glycosyltransferase family 61 protein [Chitinophagaceae bacterium]|nr:glycosyltransferase family 61 protein [Chitinophagaceae bacterium]